MRTMLLTALFAGTVTFTAAQEPAKKPTPAIPAAPIKPAVPRIAPAQPKQEITLKVGDAAPAFKADKWLQGKEVAALEKGHIYVVEFWATWCGPCIVMMPHMGEMQDHFRDKGVTFIGYTKKDPNNSEEQVTEFVKKRGPKLGYTFCYSDSPDTYNAWMRAAGQNGIPCSFVIDKDSKIAWIGHPYMLDYVLPKVVEGKWTEDTAKEADSVKQEISAVFKANGDRDPEVGLKAYAELVKTHPWAKNIPYFVVPRITKLAAAKRADEACQEAKEILAKAISRDDTSILAQLAMTLRTPDFREHKDLGAVALKAAEANLKVQGESNTMALISVADTNLAFGDKARGIAMGEKVIEAAKTAAQLAAVFRSTDMKSNKVLMGKVLTKAETQLKTAGDSDTNALMNVADAHFALGDKDKAKEFGVKAVEAAKTPALKTMLERRVKAYDN